MRPPIPQQYRLPAFRQLDPAYRNSLVSSASAGLLFLLAVLIVPKPATELATLEAIPERLAKLVLEKERPKSGSPAPAPSRVEAEKAPEIAKSTPEPAAALPKPPAAAPRRTESVQPAPNRGKVGRERAQQDVTKQVASVTKSLDASLDKLAKALPAADSKSSNAGAARARGRQRNVRSGRGSSEIGEVAALSSGAGAEVGGGLGSASVSLGSASEFVIESAGGDGPGGSGSGGSGSGPGKGNGSEVRSNASLLAVVKRYAAGIQYCYDDALKSTPELRGKLVLSITVAADGSVRQVHVVQDKLASAAVRSCVLTQVEDWRFPAVPAGEVTFQTPFVFTPGG